MARDHLETIRSLRRMTVSNGCTPSEADNADRMAEALCAKHGLPKGYGKDDSASRAKPKADPFDFTGYAASEFLKEAMRQAAQHAREEMARRASKAYADAAKTKPQYNKSGGKGPDGKTKADFKSVRECAEWYMRDGWINVQTKKRLSNAEVAAIVRNVMGSETSDSSIAWYKAQARKGK